MAVSCRLSVLAWSRDLRELREQVADLRHERSRRRSREWMQQSADLVRLEPLIGEVQLGRIAGLPERTEARFIAMLVLEVVLSGGHARAEALPAVSLEGEA